MRHSFYPYEYDVLDMSRRIVLGFERATFIINHLGPLRQVAAPSCKLKIDQNVRKSFPIRDICKAESSEYALYYYKVG